MWFWVTFMVEKTKVGNICVSQTLKYSKLFQKLLMFSSLKKFIPFNNKISNYLCWATPETIKSSQMLEITRSFVR